MQFGAFFAPLNNKDSKNEKEQPIFSKFAKIFWERLLSPWFPLFLCCISSKKKGGKTIMTQPIRYLQTDPGKAGLLSQRRENDHRCFWLWSYCNGYGFGNLGGQVRDAEERVCLGIVSWL